MLLAHLRSHINDEDTKYIKIGGQGHLTHIAARVSFMPMDHDLITLFDHLKGWALHSKVKDHFPPPMSAETGY